MVNYLIYPVYPPHHWQSCAGRILHPPTNQPGVLAEKVFDPATGDYVAIEEISRQEFGSYFEAADRDRQEGKIKSAESLLFVARADDPIAVKGKINEQ